MPDSIFLAHSEEAHSLLLLDDKPGKTRKVEDIHRSQWSLVQLSEILISGYSPSDEVKLRQLWVSFL